MVLLVNPVLLGKGKRLFPEGTPPRAFELASTKAMSSGIVINKLQGRWIFEEPEMRSVSDAML